MATSQVPTKERATPASHGRTTSTRFPRRAAEVAWSALVVWDVAIAFVLIELTMAVAQGEIFSGRWSASGLGAFSVTGLTIVAVGVAILAGSGTYGRRSGLTGASARVFGAVVVAGMGATLVGIFVGAATNASEDLGQMLAIAIVLPAAWALPRLALRGLLSTFPERVLVIGTGPVAQRVLEITRRHPQLGIEVMGFLDDDPLPMEPGSPPVVGGLATLREVAARERVDRVIVAFTQQGDVDVLALLRACDPLGIDVDVVPRMFDLMGPNPVARSFEGLPLVGVQGSSTGPGASRIKRVFDLVGVALLSIVAVPLTAIIALMIKLDDGGPVFFRQTRAGMGGAPFEVLKFRTMRVDGEREDADVVAGLEAGVTTIADVVREIKADDDPRVTRVGRFLRTTSLDELPQLWNVTKGEMSVVGPRPLRRFEVDSLADWQSTRQSTRPGITGFWQVLGRSSIPWGERIQLDYDYVRHWSLRLDLWILMRTLPAVARRRGAK